MTLTNIFNEAKYKAQLDSRFFLAPEAGRKGGESAADHDMHTTRWLAFDRILRKNCSTTFLTVSFYHISRFRAGLALESVQYRTAIFLVFVLNCVCSLNSAPPTEIHARTPQFADYSRTCNYRANVSRALHSKSFNLSHQYGRSHQESIKHVKWHWSWDAAKLISTIASVNPSSNEPKSPSRSSHSFDSFVLDEALTNDALH